MNGLLKKHLKEIAKKYGTKTYFYKKLECSGYAFPWKKKLFVRIGYDNRPETQNWIIMTFFHELGHNIDYKNGIYKKYNSGFFGPEYAKKYALKAEQHADMTGEKLCKKYFPKIKWIPSYRNKEDKKWLKKWLKKEDGHDNT
jgi:hypothetical protein